MPRRARRQTLDAITFNITRTGDKLTSWSSAASRRGITLEQLVERTAEHEILAGGRAH
ncbi:MAG TPA: hypothetical protein VIV58_00495 [Kofleriaceae bacterium]